MLFIMYKLFCTFICSIDFGFGCTACCDSLTSGGPVYGPPSQMRYPEIDQDLNRSSFGWTAALDGVLWSWGAQLASHREVMELLSIGNLRKLWSLSLSLLWKDIPRDLEPLRKRTTCLVWATCLCVAQDEYCASMFVIVEMSGRVETDSQFEETTMDWYFLVTISCSLLVYFWSLILSTGRPDLYGDFGVSTKSSCKFWPMTRLSTNDY